MLEPHCSQFQAAIFVHPILHSGRFISKLCSSSDGLEFTSTFTTQRKPGQHVIQLAPVTGNDLYQLSELINRDLATLTHKLLLLLKIIGSFEMHSFEGSG